MIPKVDLHVHLEGTITPTMVKRIAERNGLAVPYAIFGPDETYRWNDFLDFIATYDKAAAVLRTIEDYHDITYDYLARIAKVGTIYAELIVSPDHGALCGLNYHDNMQGVISGIKQAKRDFDIEARILVGAVRHFGVQSCIKTATQAVENPNPYIIGFGMAGDEINYPAPWFVEAFKIAHQGGLQCTVHAGEVVGPESVWQAIDNLPVKRIGHGVRSIEDPLLVKELVKRDITLEVCPGSNIRLKVYPDFKSHPFLQLKQHGVRIALGADDPPHFDTTIGKEYDNVVKYFGLKKEDLLEITRNGIRASFLDEKMKERLLQKVG